MPRNGSSTARLRLSLSRGCCEERCPPGVAAPNGRVKWGLPIDRRQYSAHAALEALGIVCACCSHHVGNHPGACMQRASLAMRNRGLVASHPALRRGWARLVARDLVMRAYVYRDEHGFWMAHIEETNYSPENSGVVALYRRVVLPVPLSATKEEAEAALRRVMSREARCPRHGHR